MFKLHPENNSTISINKHNKNKIHVSNQAAISSRKSALVHFFFYSHLNLDGCEKKCMNK